MPQTSPSHPSGSKKKRYRKQTHASQLEEPEQVEDGSLRKKSKSCQAWKNLDIVLSLQSKGLTLASKLDAAFEYVSSKEECRKQQCEPLQVTRSAAFLGDWMQHCMITSGKKEKAPGVTEIFSDFRCWTILKFGLEMSSFRISINILRPIAAVVSHALLWLQSGDISGKDENSRLYAVVFECLSLLFASHGRVVNNAGVDLWVSCAVAAVGVVGRICSEGSSEVLGSNALLRLSNLVLEQFTTYLRFHSSPRNVFHPFVDRLLEPLMELVVILHKRNSDGGCGFDDRLLILVEGLVSNGLFHQAHMNGFLASKSLNLQLEGDGKSFPGSYHRHLFKKLKIIVMDNKRTALAGFGFLFGCLVTKAKKIRNDCASYRGSQLSEKELGEISEASQVINLPLFELFMHLIGPLMLECKKCVDGDPITFGENEFMVLHLVKSMNTILAELMHEKIHTNTEDTVGENYNFLKDMYVTIVSISVKLYKLWSSKMDLMLSECQNLKVWILIATELVVSIGHLLEIEYRIIGDNLTTVWHMLLSSLFIGTSSMDSKCDTSLKAKVLHVGCQLINLYTELRQVDVPIFALCKAMRFFFLGDNVEAFIYGKSLSSKSYAEVMATLILSQQMKLTTSNAIKSIPEGQASVFVERINEDVGCSLKWIRDQSLRGEKPASEKASTDDILYLNSQFEILGILSELYAIIVDSLPLKVSNGNSVRVAVENILCTIRPALSSLVGKSAKSDEDYLYLVTGLKITRKGLSKLWNSSISVKPSSSWLFIFLFRIYICCRNLYQQVIPFLPKNAENVAEAMANMFLVAHGESWLKAHDTGNYFTWITAPSIPLLDLIDFLSTVFLQRNGIAYFPLTYILVIMSLQRLTDLKRKMKVLEHLLERKAHSACSDSLSGNVLLLDVDKGDIEQKTEESKKEAVALTRFITGYLPLVDFDGEVFSSWCSAPIKDAGFSLESSVFLLNEKTLPFAAWQLLCQNASVWCQHAETKVLKRFISPIIYHTIKLKHSGTASDGKIKGSEQDTFHGFLSGLLVLDHMALSRHFASALLRYLKKLLSPLFSYAGVCSTILSSLPDWSEALSILDHFSFAFSDFKSLSSVTPCCHEDRSYTVVIELKACQRLMDLLCVVVKVNRNAKSIRDTVTSIFNIEKLLLLTFIRCKDGFSSFSCFTLLKLFVSCRRVLKYIGVALSEESMVYKKSPFEMISCGNPLTITWLLRSASEVVALPQCFFGMEHHLDTKELFFSLMDHTSHLFFVLTRSLLLSCLPSTLNDEITYQGPSVCDSVGADTVTGHSNKSCPLSDCHAWKHLEVVVENLKEGINFFLKSSKDNMFGDSIDLDNASVKFNKISCLVSCIQGFLNGLSSFFSSKHVEESWRHTLNFLHPCCSKLFGYIDLFSGLVNICLSMLLIDSQAIECGFDNLLLTFEHSLSAVETATEACILGNVGRGSDKQVEDVCTADECENSVNHTSNGSTKHKAKATNFLDSITSLDLSRLHGLRRDLLQRLLRGDSLEMAFFVRQLFISSAIALHLYLTLPSLDLGLQSSGVPSYLISLLVGAPYHVLLEMTEMNEIHSFSCKWLDGPIMYLEVLGRYFYSVDTVLSKNVYSHLIDAHIRAIGKCISSLGKSAGLVSLGSKNLLSECNSSRNEISLMDYGGHCVDKLKARLGASFIKFVRTPAKLHFFSAVQALERALVGAHKDFHGIYEVDTGKLSGGYVSSVAAAGVVCFDLILESVPGNRHYAILKKHTKSLIGSLFNLVAHLKSPTIFHQVTLGNGVGESCPHPGATILMCVEVLTKFAGKSHAYEMDPCYVAQALNLPMFLFHSFHCHGACQVQNHTHKICGDIDRHFSVKLYASCCRLLCSTIRNRKRESVDSIFLFQGSVQVLLVCLETTCINILGSKDIAWTRQEAAKCASFLRRVYEEIRQQKDLLGSHAVQFLSNYINVASGFGPLKSGLEREVEEALRPGIYALVDICSSDDLQLIHTVLEETSCRRTLATLQRDYKMNFQYQGKI